MVAKQDLAQQQAAIEEERRKLQEARARRAAAQAASSGTASTDSTPLEPTSPTISPIDHEQTSSPKRGSSEKTPRGTPNLLVLESCFNPPHSPNRRAQHIEHGLYSIIS
jgi:hypothetical protein